MKIITKIASLALLTLCLQVDAAQYSPGIDGIKTTCAVFMRSGTLKVSGPASAQFQKVYGLEAKNICPYLSDINAIQAFINLNFNAGAGQFNSAKEAQNFADLVGTQSYFFAGNIFPLVGGQTYYQIATAQIENEVKTQTAGVATREAALTTIATSVATLRGRAAPAAGAAVDLAALTRSIERIDTNEKEARDYLNSIAIRWNAAAAPAKFIPSPTPSSITLAGYKLNDFMQKTFTRRLQQMLMSDPAGWPAFAPLVQDLAAAPLATDILNPTLTAQPKDYSAAEVQADAVIKAMANQITLTNTELDTVALPAAVATALPAGPLSAKAHYILGHMTGAVVTAKGAITAALNGVMALAGYTPVAPAPAASAPAVPPVIDEVALATAAATAITATDLELVRVAGTLAPAFALPAAPATLQVRATALLNKLSAGGGSAGITTYLNSLNAQAGPASFQSSINTVRGALGYGLNSGDQYDVIRDIFANIPAAAAGATAEDKVKAAITYLTTQLYTSFMWVTKAKDAAGMALPGVPAFVGDAKNVALATQNRINALIGAITTLHTQNAALTAAAAATAAAARAGGVAGPETDPSVIKVTTEVERLAGILNDCQAVQAGIDAATKLPLLDAAVTQMANALTALSVDNTGNPIRGIPAADGAALVTLIQDQIKKDFSANLTGRLTTNITKANTVLSNFIDLPGLAAVSFTNLNANAQILLNIIQTLAHSAGIKDTAGAAIPAVNAAGPFVLAAGTKLAPATLAAAIEKGITDKVVIPVAPVVAALNFTGADTLRINRLTTAGLQATPATANAFIDGSITALAALVTKSGVTGPFTDVNALSADCLAALSKTTDLTARVSGAKATWRTNVAAALINPALNAELSLTALPATFNLAALTTDAPTAAATLGEVGNYLRQCALAANELKVLAGLTVTPATMQDLMTQSATAIRAKFAPAAAAPAPVVAPAAAAAVIPQAVIDGHNAQVKFMVSLFNNVKATNTAAQPVKTAYYGPIPALNDAADAINGINPGAAKKISFQVSATDTTPLAVNAKKTNITGTTVAVAA